MKYVVSLTIWWLKKLRPHLKYQTIFCRITSASGSTNGEQPILQIVLHTITESKRFLAVSSRYFLRILLTGRSPDKCQSTGRELEKIKDSTEIITYQKSSFYFSFLFFANNTSNSIKTPHRYIIWPTSITTVMPSLLAYSPKTT